MPIDESDFLSELRITIVGLGLMGGSLALALGDSCRQIHGIDTDEIAVQMALGLKIIGQGSTSLADLLPHTDLLVLSAPVKANLEILATLPDLHPGSLAVMDLSSTKQHIVTAMDSLPARFTAVGGHPMCGKETSGLVHADPDLFREANFFLTETNKTTPELRAIAEEVAITIDSRPQWVDAETHDRGTAASSHLPYLISSALVSASPEDAVPFISTGFQSTSRLAGSSATMMLDILTTNREQVLEALVDYRRVLDQIENSLRSSPDRLGTHLETIREKRRRLLEQSTGQQL